MVLCLTCAAGQVQSLAFGSTGIFTQIKPRAGGHPPSLSRCTAAWQKDREGGEAGAVKQSSQHSTAPSTALPGPAEQHCQTAGRAPHLRAAPCLAQRSDPAFLPHLMFVCPRLQLPPEAEREGWESSQGLPAPHSHKVTHSQHGGRAGLFLLPAELASPFTSVLK